MAWAKKNDFQDVNLSGSKLWLALLTRDDLGGLWSAPARVFLCHEQDVIQTPGLQLLDLCGVLVSWDGHFLTPPCSIIWRYGETVPVNLPHRRLPLDYRRRGRHLDNSEVGGTRNDWRWRKQRKSSTLQVNVFFQVTWSRLPFPVYPPDLEQYISTRFLPFLNSCRLQLNSSSPATGQLLCSCHRLHLSQEGQREWNV